MRAIRRVVVLSIIIVAAILGREAQACGIGFQLYLPFFSIGFGLGVPSAFTCAYPCGATVAYDSPQPVPPSMQPAPEAPPVTWTPRTSGPGHWVPDPQPYRYVPGTPAKTSKPHIQAVLEKRTLGDVPVYVVQTVP